MRSVSFEQGVSNVLGFILEKCTFAPREFITECIKSESVHPIRTTEIIVNVCALIFLILGLNKELTRVGFEPTTTGLTPINIFER